MLVLWLATPLWAAGDGWMTDFEAAKKEARAEGKDLLIHFTGSDWCGWCIKLKKEVFDQPAFKAMADEKFVCIVLDFPRSNKLPAATVRNNAALLEKYAVGGFPTVILCDDQGRPYARTGYRRGGADAYLTHLDELLERKKQRDEALAKAERMDGPDKARMLEQALASVPFKCLVFYEDVLQQIASADPEDTSGFMAKVNVEKASKQLRDLINPLFKERQFAAVIVQVDAFIKKNQPAGEALQTAMLYKLHALYLDKKYDDALMIADQILEVNDTSKAARFSSMIRTRLKKLKQAEQQGVE